MFHEYIIIIIFIIIILFIKSKNKGNNSVKKRKGDSPFKQFRSGLFIKFVNTDYFIARF